MEQMCLQGSAAPHLCAMTVHDLSRRDLQEIPYLSFASSAQLYDAMTKGAPESRKAATERYLTLLRSGGNDHPMEQLRKAGVDLTQRSTIQAVIDQMDRLVTQMEAESAKIN